MDTETDRPLCSSPGYDPEWWTLLHPGRCDRFCPHGLAAHICLNHCPLLARCQDMAALNLEVFSGMVVGGLIWDSRPSKKEFRQPPLRLQCEACQPELALVS